jgi:transcriptional regulator with XRE-family HTH domain
MTCADTARTGPPIWSATNSVSEARGKITQALIQRKNVPSSDRSFYLAFGQRIAEARRAQGSTQAQLAEQLGIAQQTLAHYESGRLRVAVAMLSPLARTLGMSIEELVGERPSSAKRGPAPKLQQQMERIQRLPRAKQRFIMDMIETVLHQSSK